MERFQVERSPRRKTTAFLPSWGGIPTRQPSGRRGGEAALLRRALCARCATRAPSPSGCGVQLGNPDSLRPGRGLPMPGPGEAKSRFVGFSRGWRDGALFSVSDFLEGSWKLPEGKWGSGDRPPVSSLDAQDEGGSEGIREVVGQGGKYLGLQTKCVSMRFFLRQEY